MYTDIVFHTISGNQQVAMMNVPFIIFFCFFLRVLLISGRESDHTT